MKKQYIIALLWASAQFCYAQIPPFEGSDNFVGASKNPAKWGDNIFNGTGLLTQTGGVLKFSNAVPSGDDEDHFMAWPWQSYGPMETSWSVQADVNVPVIALPDDHAAIGVGVAVRNGADGNDMFAIQVENVRSTGQPQQYNFYNSLDINEDNHSELSTPAPTGKVLSVRIVWNADTLTLTAQYDADGPANGYSWQTLNSFNPVFNGWEMAPLDTFEVAVFGYAEKMTVAASKNVYLDNFLIGPVAPLNLAGSDNFNDDTRDPGKWGADEGEGGSVLTEVNDRLEFTKSDTVDSWAGRPWIANTGSFTEDWEAYVDVHIGDLAMGNDGDDLRIFLGVGVGPFNASVQLELTQVGGDMVRQFRFEEEGPGLGADSAPTTATDGALRVAFDSTEKILNFFYDEDGGVGGYAWTPLGSVDVDDELSDWGLSEFTRFRVGIFGESEGVVVNTGDAYADNFNGMSAYAPLIFASPNGFDHFTEVGKNTQKWGEEIHEGDGEFTQDGDGVLRFTGSGVGEEDMKARLWQANGTFSASWSVQADVHVPVIPLEPGHTAAGLGIAVLNSADPDDNFTSGLENYRTTGQPQDFHYLSTLDINGVGSPEIFAPTSSTLGAVRIAWNHLTKQLTAAYDADGPLNGYHWIVFQTFSPAATTAAGGWGMVAANSFKIAIYGSSEETEVTLDHNFYIDNFYVFGSLTTVLPVVKTLAADVPTHDTVTLRGSVDGKGSERAVFFEYGLTTMYGTTIAATPATVGAPPVIGVVNVSAPLMGLLPHTKYNYRARAGSALGSALGTNMAFTTKNRFPTPDPDTFAVLPGAVVILNVLGDDTDPDGDPLSLASITPLIPASAGKLLKSGNNITFTAAAGFGAGGATFNYTAKDAFGGSTTAAVGLTLGTCELTHSQVFPLPSAGVAYDIDVDAAGAWSVVENLSWISAAPLAGSGPGTVRITLLPNAGLPARTGTVMIGGQPHIISQAGVLLPEISLGEDPPPPAIVSGFYQLAIDTVNAPVTYTVTNLPPGLTLNQATGIISGRPTKAGDYAVTVKAKNAAGNAGGTPATVLSFTISVAVLDPAFVGSFHGLITPHPLLNADMGSRIELTITATGGVTGKVITGITPKSITGHLNADPANPDAPVFNVSLPFPGGDPLELVLTFEQSSGSFAGLLTDPVTPTDTPVAGWRNAWSAKHKATAFKSLHTFSLEQVVLDPGLPQGFGFGSFTPNETTGAVTLGGKLADNTPFATTTFIGEQGQVLVYSSLYGNKGSLSGILTVIENGAAASDNDILSSLVWFKPLPPPPVPPALPVIDTVYPLGIGPVALVAEGGAYTGILPGQVVMGLDDELGNAKLTGSHVAESEFDFTFRLNNPSATGLTNRAIFPLDNPNLVTMPGINPGTGAFNGEYTLPGVAPLVNRKVAYQGLLVKLATGGFRGRGYSLVPAPYGPPMTLALVPKWSGRIVLGPSSE